ncbi:hypothetical protein [Prevotella intermedia]|uniref:hypothetical protein n=1 Tax=Prevotella intermedia TaxID=28131 RepID=UPI00025D6319|nr:hypothetical protein [Prevotella intermedia]AFJ09667.1 hypothetical protein PIN17_A1326 [Prevotella intermedia 17]
MKKLLLLAFTAILGMSVNAQESLLSERPDGVVKVYDRAGKGIKLQQGDGGSLEMTSLNLADASELRLFFSRQQDCLCKKPNCCTARNIF